VSTMDRVVVPTSDPVVVAKADQVFAELQVASRRLRRVHGLVNEVALLDDAGLWLDAGALTPLTRNSPHLLTESPQVSTGWRGQGSG